MTSTSPAEFLLVRHGQTQCSLRGLICGECGSELTAAGRAMAKMLAAALGPVRRVVASPAARATQTAAMIAAPDPVVEDLRLAETNFGIWEGQRVHDLARTRVYQAWVRDPVIFRPPGGEAGATVLARALAALLDYGINGDRVAIVSHKHLIRLITAYAIDLPLYRYREVPVPVSSVTWIRLGSSGLSVAGAASVGHLPPAWRSDPDHVRPDASR